MIDEVQLREIAADTGTPVGTVEKELAVACFLHALSNDSLREHLVFKGGTAIKMIYYPKSRFSEDLDFTVPELGKDEAINRLHEMIDGKRIDSITFRETSEERFSQQGQRLRLPFAGPMNFRNSIRVDLSFRNDLILGVGERPIVHKYGDELAATVKVLEFVELMAEKLRDLMSRGYARDYYDVWSHIDKIRDKDLLRRLTEEKCTLTGQPYTPSRILEEASLDQARAEWRNTLRHLITDYVEFEDILPEIRLKLAFLE